MFAQSVFSLDGVKVMMELMNYHTSRTVPNFLAN